MTAPEFDAYISYLNDRNLNSVGYNKNLKVIKWEPLEKIELK